jgi:hypothetical protein
MLTCPISRVEDTRVYACSQASGRRFMN